MSSIRPRPISLWLTEEELAFIDERAALEQRSRSGWLKLLIMSEMRRVEKEGEKDER